MQARGCRPSRASDSEKFLAVQAAYEMGIAEGRLLGTIEMGEKMMAGFDAGARAAVVKATS